MGYRMEEIFRIEKKLDRVQEKISEIQIEMAKQIQIEEKHKENIGRFWSHTWPQVVEKIDDNQTKIAEMQIRITKMQTQMYMIASLIAFGAPIITAVLLKFI